MSPARSNSQRKTCNARWRNADVISWLRPERTTIAGHPAVRIGDGSRTLLVIPGLNDPLCRVTERWWFDALMGRFMQQFTPDRTVYAVSRPADLPADTSVDTLTAGYSAVLDEIGPATVLGLSLGGFVGLELAANDDRVEALIMGLAAHRLNPAGKRVVASWREAALDGRFEEVYLGAANAVGTGIRRRTYRLLGRLYARTATPPCAADFVPTATACIQYDGRKTLSSVSVPTLVVGGTADEFFAGMDFATTADSVQYGRLVEIPNTGHEAVIEGPAFERAVQNFLDAPYR